ncbi:MAG: hypothetical protein ABSG03_01670 [Bryobacteraceae bacterium]|jgi:hypothetical protein
MTKNVLTRFRAALSAKIAELERLTSQPGAIAVEEGANQPEEIWAERGHFYFALTRMSPQIDIEPEI